MQPIRLSAMTVIGVSLSILVSLPAGAGGRALDSGAHHAALRAQLQLRKNYQALGEILHNSQSLPSAEALSAHMLMFGGENQRIDLVRRAGKSLYLYEGALKVSNRGKEADAQTDDLAHFGITHVDHLTGLLGKKLREVVGAEANEHTDDKALAAHVLAKAAKAQILVSTIALHADAELLRAHHERVTLPRDSTSPGVELLGSGDESLLLTDSGELTINTGGPARAASFGDLTRLRLSTPAEYKALLAERVLVRAGLKGRGPVVLTKARAVLRREIDDMAWLEESITHLAHDPDVSFLAELLAATGKGIHSIAKKGKRTLSLNPHLHRLCLSTCLSTNKWTNEWATAGDLAHFGITSQATFKAAIRKAIDGIPVSAVSIK